MKRTLIAATAALTLLTACDSGPRLETRTYALTHLAGYEAAALVEPYIYGDREAAPGTMSQSERALTVRETPDNLDQIARVLAEFDVPRPDVRLHFQLIEADGFREQDPRIREVEEQLRKVFQFDGYRLVGEAFVSATDGSTVEQGLGADYAVEGRIFFRGPGALRLDEIRLYANSEGSRLSTTVNIQTGQTLILGSASLPGEDTTLLLTVRAEEITD